MEKQYWVSTKYATGLVTINETGLIVTTPLVWKRYRGKYFSTMKNDLDPQVVCLGKPEVKNSGDN